MKSNLFERTLTGIGLIIGMVLLMMTNKIVITLAFMVLSTIAVFELSRVLSIIDLEPIKRLAFIFNILLISIGSFISADFALVSICLYAFILFFILIFKEDVTFKNILANIFISLYITLSYALLMMVGDTKWLIFALLISSFTDTFAYIVGVLIGKHKLIERLSPKKTIEGSIGGLLGGLVFVIIFVRVYNLDNHFIMYLAGILIAAFSQMGDLFASYIKRKAGVKDYGRILRGHGGIMDRFDSILVVSPLVFALVRILELV